MANSFSKMSETVRSVFVDFISNEVPKRISNILWSLFLGIQGMFEHLEYKIDIFIRERNMLTATHKASLRSLAAENGFEPSLKIPAKGIVSLKISQSAYNKYGHPLFILPYSEFKCKDNNLTYYYDSDKALSMTENSYNLTLTEGSLKTLKEKGTGDSIQRIYITDKYIAENSIIIKSNDLDFIEVKSFFDNQGLNNDRQFMLKFSKDVQKPIILYIKGAEKNDITITYRQTFGEIGNIIGVSEFETDDIINYNGLQISLTKDELSIKNIYGFTLGSEGTDENNIRAAIGYNHGNNLLYDNISYSNFLRKFSTIILQNIYVNEDTRQLNNIYVFKKNILNIDTQYIIEDYKKCIANGNYLISTSDKNELSNILKENEYCLSSHTINNPKIIKYAFQIMFDNNTDKDYHSLKISKILYTEFSKFLYDRSYKFLIDQLLSDYQTSNNVEFDYYVFTSIDIYDNNIVKHGEYLPLLEGDFDITVVNNDSTATTTQYITLFEDINYVIKI